MTAQPETEKISTREQRDRFLAFSFASADLFIEVSEEGKIAFALGAAKGMTGIDDKALTGKSWLELFSAYDQAQMQTTWERAKPGKRYGPALIALNENLGAGSSAIFSAIKMPGSNKFYLTLGVGNEIMNKIAVLVGLPQKPQAQKKESFMDYAFEALESAKSGGQSASMTFFDFAPTAEEKTRFGEDAWKKFNDAVGALLAEQSIGGNSAGEIAEGRYSLLHGDTVAPDTLKEKIAALAKECDPAGKGLEVRVKTTPFDLKTMGMKDISRFVENAVREFEQGGAAAVSAAPGGKISPNQQKIKEFKGFIERVSFSQMFQPIVSLETREAHHYEILTRFEKGDTLEWVRLGDDAGLTLDFDMAVCERAVNYITFKAGGTRAKFSINVAASSLRNEKFMEKFMHYLDKHKTLSERILLEIREALLLEEPEILNGFVKKIRGRGVRVVLDDFGPSLAALQRLQVLNVDYVKLQGKYAAQVLSSEREAALVKNLADVCKTQRVEVIAKHIEDPAQAKIFVDSGVLHGQGFLYAKPGAKPDYLAAK